MTAEPVTECRAAPLLYNLTKVQPGTLSFSPTRGPSQIVTGKGCGEAETPIGALALFFSQTHSRLEGVYFGGGAIALPPLFVAGLVAGGNLVPEFRNRGIGIVSGGAGVQCAARARPSRTVYRLPAGIAVVSGGGLAQAR